MEENSNEKDRENLSMEEYLKRRQAVKTRGNSFTCIPGSRFCQCITDCSILFMIKNCLWNHLSTVV